MRGRPNGWWISPAIPAIANCALAVLWGFSALGGWGEAAFCGEGHEHDSRCADGFGAVVWVSAVPALPALMLGLCAWVVPQARRRSTWLLMLAAGLWVAAEAVVFVGGFLAQP